MSGLDTSDDERLFVEASRLPREEREVFLRTACAGDGDRADALLALLAERDAGVPEVLAGWQRQVRGAEVRPAESSVTGASIPGAERPGVVIGRYTLIEEIGRGGYGVVYLAEQTEPVRRRVALKIIKPGMDSEAVVGRFEQERQALAVMDHPNIAKVIDGGVTSPELGCRLYFVLEYVAGEPITVYCDRRSLTIRRRLDLFVSVCEAVQHAHHKGIIHRDIKPSNILVAEVDGQAAPKVIDFGIAKAISEPLVTKGVATDIGSALGTIGYMSPEQAVGSVDVDTRTDVYSLGAVLYELLTGLLPFDVELLQAAGMLESNRMICEQEVPRPSTRLSTSPASAVSDIAVKRGTLARDLTHELRRELEWIPLKALRKDRRERYRTVSELGDDLENYFACRALVAGPARTGYKLRKFVGRKRGLVAAAAGVLLALLAGLAGTLWQANHATERAQAEHKMRSRAVAIKDFLKNSLASSDPNQNGEQDALVVEAMAKALSDLNSGVFKDDPEIDAELRDTIATILRGNGRAMEAEPLFQQALDIRRHLFNGDHPDVADSLNNLGYVRQLLGRTTEAEALYVQALEMRGRLFKGDHADVANSLNNLGYVRGAMGKNEEAESYYMQALEMRQRLFKGDHPDVARSLNNVAHVRNALGHAAEAESFYLRALEMRRRLFKSDHPEIALNLNNLGKVTQTLGRFAEAETLYKQALEMNRRLFKGDHPDVALSLNNLAYLYEGTSRTADAEPLFQLALEMNQRLFKGDHHVIAVGLNNVASARSSLSRFAEAEPLFQQSLEMRQRLFPGDHVAVADAMSNLAAVRFRIDRAAEAEPLFRQALEMYQRLFPGGHPNIAVCMNNLARVRRALGRVAEAEQLYEQALRMNQQYYPGDHPDVALSMNNLASLRMESGRSAEAEPMLRDALAMYQRIFKQRDHRSTANAMTSLARCLGNLGKTDEALKFAEDAAAMASRFLPEKDAVRKKCEENLAGIRETVKSSLHR